MARNTTARKAAGTQGSARSSGARAPNAEERAPHDRKRGIEAPGGEAVPPKNDCMSQASTEYSGPGAQLPLLRTHKRRIRTIRVRSLFG
ncbi:hypothetical protein ACWGI8_18255 [Streptomyces sp. NPDC054841]